MDKTISWRFPDGKTGSMPADHFSFIAAGFMGKLTGEDQRRFEEYRRTLELPAEPK